MKKRKPKKQPYKISPVPPTPLEKLARRKIRNANKNILTYASEFGDYFLASTRDNWSPLWVSISGTIVRCECDHTYPAEVFEIDLADPDYLQKVTNWLQARAQEHAKSPDENYTP